MSKGENYILYIDFLRYTKNKIMELTPKEKAK